jgi:hypothetical protein
VIAGGCQTDFSESPRAVGESFHGHPSKNETPSDGAEGVSVGPIAVSSVGASRKFQTGKKVPDRVAIKRAS